MSDSSIRRRRHTEYPYPQGGRSTDESPQSPVSMASLEDDATQDSDATQVGATADNHEITIHDDTEPPPRTRVLLNDAMQALTTVAERVEAGAKKFIPTPIASPAGAIAALAHLLARAGAGDEAEMTSRIAGSLDSFGASAQVVRGAIDVVKYIIHGTRATPGTPDEIAQKKKAVDALYNFTKGILYLAQAATTEEKKADFISTLGGVFTLFEKLLSHTWLKGIWNGTAMIGNITKGYEAYQMTQAIQEVDALRDAKRCRQTRGGDDNNLGAAQQIRHDTIIQIEAKVQAKLTKALISFAIQAGNMVGMFVAGPVLTPVTELASGVMGLNDLRTWVGHEMGDETSTKNLVNTIVSELSGLTGQGQDVWKAPRHAELFGLGWSETTSYERSDIKNEWLRILAPLLPKETMEQLRDKEANIPFLSEKEKEALKTILEKALT